MKQVLEPLSLIPGVRMALLVSPDGVPVIVRGRSNDERGVDLSSESGESLAALARLYQRIDAHARALDVLVQHARLEGERGADLWMQAGEVAAEALGDPDVGLRHYERALSLDPRHHRALLGLSRLHQAAGQWANAATRLLEAADHTTNRREKIDLLLEAASLQDERLDHPRAAAQPGGFPSRG